MSDLKDKFDKVALILRSEGKSLSELAALSGRDIFSFYRGADLTDLDLTGQNLMGLNFDYADLRFSNLSNILYDAGAFNCSYLDENQHQLADEFTFYLDDLRSHNINEVLIYFRIRPGIIDTILTELSIPYRSFSKSVGVSENALRKARNGGVLSWETATAIMRGYEKLALEMSETGDSDFAEVIKQPCVEFLSGGMNADFRHVTNSRLTEVLEKKRIVDRSRMGEDIATVRETPEAIEWLYDYLT